MRVAMPFLGNTNKDLARRWRPRLAFSVKSVISAIIAFILTQALKLPLPLWAAVTAVVVTQLSVGRSLKATINYFVGTIVGAIYGGAIGVSVPNSTELAMVGAVALTLAPLVVVAATNPDFTAAPITGLIVLLIPTTIHSSPLVSALYRVLEVALGGASGLAVSLVFPLTAHRQFAEAAAKVLNQMAQVLEVLLGKSQHRLDRGELDRLQDAILQAVSQLSTVSGEAEYERMLHFAGAGQTVLLLRTIARLRYDLVTIGRAVSDPLLPDINVQLEAPIAQIRATFADYLRRCGEAILKHRAPSLTHPIEAALQSCADVRRGGQMRKLFDNSAERLFAFGFALEEMGHDIQDLACYARSSPPRR